MMNTDESSDDALATRVAGVAEWYHTLELAPGLVTPGWFDTRDMPTRLPIPGRLDRKRCLDVGTFDGFWAFELERRGAEEVVAIDIIDPNRWDWPASSGEEVIEALARRKGAGQGFEIARDALGSAVERLELSVYDLTPERVGQFDFVYLGSLLLHLRDPVGALSAVRSVCRGQTLVVDVVDVELSLRFRKQPLATLDGRGRPWWWKPNEAGLVRMMEAGGFEVVGSPQRVYMRPGPGQPLPNTTLRMLTSRAGRGQLILKWRGDPHAAVLGRPVD